MITELVPYVEGTTRVDIEAFATVLHTVQAGAAAPSVSITTPNGGEMLAEETIHVAWTANDSDGDSLIFNIQYSPDGGQHWEMVAQFITETSVDIDASNIVATTQGLFRVWVSDGIHTTGDESNNTFTVPNRIPVVEIVEPNDGETKLINATIGLRGEAYDIDTGTMADDQLQWLSSIDGLLGRGKQLSINDLSEGVHTIIFRADDGNGGVAEDSVQLTIVGEDTSLPDKLLVGPQTLLFEPANGLTSKTFSVANQSGEHAIRWTAATNETWLQLDTISGMTPATVIVTLVDTSLTNGIHSANIILTSPDVPNQSVTVRASVMIIKRSQIYLPFIRK
ncbi:MAG: BACON domain-containing protein [Ardenticatenaceae bacterium]|nr:BACON domain-containing protein [Ardenticatenaceae bacterium]